MLLSVCVLVGLALNAAAILASRRWDAKKAAAVEVVEPHPLDVRRRVVVGLHGDRAIDGVLWQRSDGWLVLRDARLLVPGMEPARIDGEAVVEAPQVEFVQLLGTGGDA